MKDFIYNTLDCFVLCNVIVCVCVCVCGPVCLCEGVLQIVQPCPWDLHYIFFIEHSLLFIFLRKHGKV